MLSGSRTRRGTRPRHGQRRHRDQPHRLAALCTACPRRDEAPKQADFIAATRLQGASTARIVLRDILPLVFPTVLTRLTTELAGMILTAAGPGFLGLGAQPPLAEWGAMVADGRAFLADQWWVSTLPGAAIFLVSSATSCSAPA
ncbi:peptide/nickel transport system permease protein [Rhizobium mongolense]|uniref:Peptide/nickel transport system permease protein n=1 Tax=Rhizobium mongolense TaxID=57676 RepID=A0ABR6IZX9_9HYPH|nr:peptide/nickel transport system permease protein [Rhizobium mongolense]